MKAIATWIRECDEPPFARMFAAYPDVTVWNARTTSVPWDEMHSLMLTGGSDISKEFLRQPVPDASLIQDIDPARDAWEFDALAKALKQRLPFFGICRGFQIFNVFLGGTLHLDIPHHDDAKYDNCQELRYAAGVAIQIPRVNSSHHQALDRVAPGLQIEAWSASDEIIEQVRFTDYPFGLAVQYHPERDEIYRPLFDAFVRSIPESRP